MENSAFEALKGKIVQVLERCTALQREQERLEQLASQHERETRELKKRLDHAAHERTVLKQRLMKVMQNIDSLNIS